MLFFGIVEYDEYFYGENYDESFESTNMTEVRNWILLDFFMNRTMVVQSGLGKSWFRRAR